MKKTIALLLALAMVLCLAACGGDAPAANTSNTPASSQPAEKPAENTVKEEVQESEEAAPETGYNFKGYTETADWPGEDCWTSYGLPVLPMSDDVNGTVHISDKDWIYPLNGSDGIMIEARPGASRIEFIVGALSDAGITMEEDMDFECGYTGYYDNAGNDMKITVSETGSGKLTVTIITNPTD